MQGVRVHVGVSPSILIDILYIHIGDIQLSLAAPCTFNTGGSYRHRKPPGVVNVQLQYRNARMVKSRIWGDEPKSFRPAHVIHNSFFFFSITMACMVWELYRVELRPRAD